MQTDEEKKENIFLDAIVTLQIHSRAFRAELSNGHRLVVYSRDENLRVVEVGETVRVCLSPYDMSVGKLVFEDVK